MTNSLDRITSLSKKTQIVRRICLSKENLTTLPDGTKAWLQFGASHVGPPKRVIYWSDALYNDENPIRRRMAARIQGEDIERVYQSFIPDFARLPPGLAEETIAKWVDIPISSNFATKFLKPIKPNTTMFIYESASSFDPDSPERTDPTSTGKTRKRKRDFSTPAQRHAAQLSTTHDSTVTNARCVGFHDPERASSWLKGETSVVGVTRVSDGSSVYPIPKTSNKGKAHARPVNHEPDDLICDEDIPDEGSGTRSLTMDSWSDDEAFIAAALAQPRNVRRATDNAQPSTSKQQLSPPRTKRLIQTKFHRVDTDTGPDGVIRGIAVLPSQPTKPRTADSGNRPASLTAPSSSFTPRPVNHQVVASTNAPALVNKPIATPVLGRVSQPPVLPVSSIPDFIHDKQKDKQRDFVFPGWTTAPHMEPVTSRMRYRNNNVFVRIKPESIAEYYVLIDDPNLAKEIKCITISDGEQYLIFAHVWAITRRFFYLWKKLTNSYKKSTWIPIEEGSHVAMRRDKVPDHMMIHLMRNLTQDEPGKTRPD